MNRRSGKRISHRRAAFWLLAILCGIAQAGLAHSDEPIRSTVVDPSRPDLYPPGNWTPIDRRIFEAWQRDVATGRSAAAGCVDRCEYRLQFAEGDALVGSARGTFRLAGRPAMVSLGQPSLAMSGFRIADQEAVWGTDSLGTTHVLAPMDAEAFQFQCSQQGLRRGDSLEWSMDWLTCAATRVELALPADLQLEGVGPLLIEKREAADGKMNHVFEIGARSRSIFRAHPRPGPAVQEPGYELMQAIVASSTRVRIHSDVTLIPRQTGALSAEFNSPEGFAFVRAALPTGERLPVERASPGGPIEVRLGEVPVGQRASVRVTFERPADWTKPLAVPRIAPLRVHRLREQWSLQVEKPLELIDCDCSHLLRTSLTEEGVSEVWTWEATALDASMNLTARLPEPQVVADCASRVRQAAARIEIQTAIDIRSLKAPLFDLDLEVKKPWKVISAAAIDATGASVPVADEAISENDSVAIHRLLLRSPANAAKGATLVIVTASQLDRAQAEQMLPVVTPKVQSGEQYVLRRAEPARHPAMFDPTPIAFTDLKPGLRPGGLWRAEELSGWEVRKLAPRTAVAAENSVALPAPEKARVRTSPVQPVKGTNAIAEFVTSLGSTASNSLVHRATLRFESPVDWKDERVRLAGEWSLLEVTLDGDPIDLIPVNGELHFPAVAPAAGELSIRYQTSTAMNPWWERDSIPWPQLSARIVRWHWTIESTEDSRVTRVLAPADFTSGQAPKSLAERWLTPLGRAQGESAFHPFLRADWSRLFTSASSRTASQGTRLVAASGSDYPHVVQLEWWSQRRLTWLSWAVWCGTALIVVILRRRTASAFRAAALMLAAASMAAMLAPQPFDGLCGAAFCAALLAWLAPRRLVRPAPRPIRSSPGSSIVRLATATSLLLAVLATPWSSIAAQPAMPPTILVPGNENGEVLVSERLLREIAQWQRSANSAAFLLRKADYSVKVQSSEAAAVQLALDVILPRPGVASLLLPFEGVTFRGPTSVLIDGAATPFAPTADGKGIVVTLPKPVAGSDRADSTVRTVALQLDGSLRLNASNDRREFNVTLPQCAAASGRIEFEKPPVNRFQSNSRGRTALDTRSVDCHLGTQSKWHARWKPGDSSTRRESEAGIGSRAESVVVADSESLRCHTRITVESPESPDPFSTGRLEVLLPASAFVTAVSGETVTNWRTVPAEQTQRVLIDSSAPLAVGQTFDVQYLLPVSDSQNPVIPALPLLTPTRPTSHQVAISCGPAFHVRLLTEPDPELGAWDLKPSEAAFALRKELNLPVPAAAMDLERPVELVLNLTPKQVRRSAELEQTMSVDQGAIRWSGLARIETSQWPAFVHEFRVDPEIEIASVSVMGRDVERLSRFVRTRDRLILILRDDRPGTQTVRMNGHLALEPGKSRPIPLFELHDATVTRSEIVVTSSADQLLQVRRGEQAALIGRASDATWEPAIPSSRRFSLPSTAKSLEMRWINASNPVRIAEFIELPVDVTGAVKVSWRMQSSTGLPSVLSIDAPRGTMVAEPSDYAEENRRVLPGDRVQIDLAARAPLPQPARLDFTMPSNSARASTLPALGELAVRPESWLAVPAGRVNEVDVSGDFLDTAPAQTPEHWPTGITRGDLLVFSATGINWTLGVPTTPLRLASAAEESIVSDRAEGIDGVTRWLITPSRVGLVRLEESEDVQVLAVSSTTASPADRPGELLLRPSQPASIVAYWKSKIRTGAGPRLRGVEVVRRDRVASESTRDWPRDAEMTAKRQSEIAADRLGMLLAAARSLPIGARPPAWLAQELTACAESVERSHPSSLMAGESRVLLAAWSVAPDSSTRMRRVDPESLWQLPALHRTAFDVAEGDATSKLTRDGIGQSASTTPLVLAGMAVFWLAIITRGGAIAKRLQIAERAARRPAAMLAIWGIVWWLLLTPSVAGVGIILVAAGWAVIRWRFVRT